MENKKEEESAASNGEGSSSSHGGRDTDEERIGTKRKKVQHFQNFFGDGGGAGFGGGAGGNDGGDINKDEDRIGAKRKKVQHFGNFFGDRGGMGFGGGAGVDDEGDISKNKERIGAKRKKVQHFGNFFGDGGGVGFGGGAGVDDEGDISKNEEMIGAKRKKKVQHYGNFFGDGGGEGFEGGSKGNFFRQTETEDARVSYRAELGMQSTHQAVTDNQQADFAERDRLDSGLLAWQPTQDVRYLQATAQRNTLRAVQNKQGDRPEQQGYESQPSVDQYQQQHHPPTYPMGHPNYGSMIQKTPNERKVLSSTDQTLISAHMTEHSTGTPPSHTDQVNSRDEGQPPTKKIKPCQMTDRKESESPPEDNPTRGCVSYQGVVSALVYPEGGMYELDGRVCLYLSHYDTASLGRGLRCGVKVQLHNVHLVRLSAAPYRKLSGFFCTAVSKVTIVCFSPEDSPHVVRCAFENRARESGPADPAMAGPIICDAFFPKNKLGTLLRTCGVMDTCWLLHIFMTARKLDHKKDSRSSFHISNELHRRFSLNSIARDVTMDFITGPGTSYLENEAILSLRPYMSSVASFKEEVHELCSRDKFQWRRGTEEESVQGGEARADLVYLVRMDWMWAIMKAAELNKKRVLVGIVDSCETSGSLLLRDTSGSFPLVLTFDLPSSSKRNQPIPAADVTEKISQLSLINLGTKIVVTDFVVIFEKTVNLTSTDAPSSDILIYLHITDFFVVPKSLTTPSIPGKLTPSQADCSFLVKDKENGEESKIYFRTLTKNMTVVSASGHLEFTCQALVHANLDALPHPLGIQENVEDGVDQKEEVMTIAIYFGGKAYKWFPLIQTGCAYELCLKDSSDGVLPSWGVLMKNRVLKVNEDMEIRIMEGELETSSGSDVGDVSRRLLLPAFPTRMCVQSMGEASHGSHLETISIRGMVTSRSYRIDHMSLAGKLPAVNSIPLHPTSSSSSDAPTSMRTTNKCKIIALTLQSMLSADTLTAYFEFRQGVPLPLGILPGSVITLHNLKLKMSRTGNYYCSSFALSSIQVQGGASMGSNVDARDALQLKIVHHTVSYLGDLILTLIRGRLSRSVVCVRVGYMTVYRVQLARRCRACQCVLIGGRCSATCINKRPTYEATIRFVIEDGSGCGHVYGSGGVVKECLRLTSSEWQEICGLLDDGEVVYTRGQQKILEERSVTCHSDKAKCLLHKWVTRPHTLRYFKILCQPFVSKAEKERSIIGVKSDNIRVKGLEFSTLVLPRLQLRAVAVMELDSEGYIEDCRKLLTVLEA